MTLPLGSCAGLRVVVIEDEPMITMLIQDMLEELGCTVAGTANSLEDALAICQTTIFDVGILDINLDGKTSLPIVALMTQQGKPFVLSTGYGDCGVVGTFPRVPLMQKPFSIGVLAQSLCQAITKSSEQHG